MQSKDQLLQQFSSLIPFVQSLRQLDDGKWTTPIKEGKWTTRDIVAHIMLWDQHYLGEAVEKVTQQRPVTVQHLDFDEFNKNAIQFAQTKSKQEILDMTIYYRNEIIRCLRLVPADDFAKEHAAGDGKPFSLHKYLTDFILHDHQHMEQIKAFLV